MASTKAYNGLLDALTSDSATNTSGYATTNTSGYANTNCFDQYQQAQNNALMDYEAALQARELEQRQQALWVQHEEQRKQSKLLLLRTC